MKWKLLLYCNKIRPILRKLDKYFLSSHTDDYYWKKGQTVPYNVNGKIVAECDFEVEEIFEELYGDLDWQHEYLPTTNTMSIVDLERESCLDREELRGYRYAIHLKSLHIFKEPRSLDDYEYTRRIKGEPTLRAVLTEAPQNMRKIIANGTDAILISIRPEALCKILNGEKTIVVRKKVLKEMM